MAATHTEQRTLRVPATQLFGICATILGQMRAQIESQDVERGLLVASIGVGPLGPVSELALVLTALDDRQSVLVATWRAQKRGGDRRILSAFLDSVEAMVRYIDA